MQGNVFNGLGPKERPPSPFPSHQLTLISDSVYKYRHTQIEIPMLQSGVKMKTKSCERPFAFSPFNITTGPAMMKLSIV